jgi:hypothetical protein
MEFKTEYEFILPRGYVDAEGNVHREGVMRLANAKDEIVPLNDLRVQRNRAYLIIVLLSRVITRLGTLPEVNAGVIENLFAGDLRFLEEMYNRINEDEPDRRNRKPGDRKKAEPDQMEGRGNSKGNRAFP